MARKGARITSPAGIAAYTFIKTPDVKFDADNPRYKTSVVLDRDADGVDAFLQKLEDLKVAAVMAQFPRMAPAAAAKVKLAGVQMGDEKVDRETGEPMEEFAGKVIVGAKTKYQPSCFGPGRETLPEGVWPGFGDLIKIAVEVIAYGPNPAKAGATLRLLAVQVLEKRGGGDTSDMFDDESDSYEAIAGRSESGEPASEGDDSANENGDF